MNRLPVPFLGLALTLSLAAQTPVVPASTSPTPQVEPAAPKALPPTPAPSTAPAATAAVAMPPKYSADVLKAIGPIVEGKGRLVFFRPSKFAGGAIGFIVREQDKELGKLRSGKYFVLNVEPGKHTYTVHSEASDNTILEVEAGETYFIAGSISVGFLVGHPHLACSDADAFASALPKMEPAAPLN